MAAKDLGDVLKPAHDQPWDDWMAKSPCCGWPLVWVSFQFDSQPHCSGYIQNARGQKMRCFMVYPRRNYKPTQDYILDKQEYDQHRAEFMGGKQPVYEQEAKQREDIFG